MVIVALDLLTPTEIKANSFMDSSKSNCNLNLLRHHQGGVSYKKRNYGGTGVGKNIHCSAQPPPQAWQGRAIVAPGRKTWDGPKPNVGSTSSIGTQTLDVVAENPDNFRVVALAAGSNITLLADQVKTFRPQLMAVRNESLLGELNGIDYKPVSSLESKGVIEMLFPLAEFQFSADYITTMFSSPRSDFHPLYKYPHTAA